MKNLMNPLATLREANVSRHIEWMRGASVDSLPLNFRCVELVGEIGEAANIMKKIERHRLGIAGNTADLDVLSAMLADELADVVICADLIAMDLKLPLSENSLSVYARPGYALDTLGVELGRSLSRVCGMVAALAESGPTWRKSVENHLIGALEAVIVVVQKVALSQGIDMVSAISRKFNATSRKLDFLTRIAVVPVG